MPNTSYYGIIMAGGRGTRFWPKSRRSTPKQVLNVVGERSLIQQTVDRLRPLIPPERIWVFTNEHVRDQIVKQLPDVPPKQVLAEPAQRNTAPCIGLAAHILESIDPGAVMGVFPADHVIQKPARFLRILRPAFREAAQGKLVVLGIRPRWPETGYGYIEFPRGFEPDRLEATPVLKFREKPDLKTAKKFLSAGRFYWNAGVFFWRADVFLAELRKHLARTATLLAALPAFDNRHFGAELRKTYPLAENISVDYAVLEKAANVTGFATENIDWNDVGSWNAVYELLSHDEHGNACRADLLSDSSTGNYVDANGKLVALLGVRDLIVVDTPDALLIADRFRAQEVGNIVKELERRKRESLL